MSKKTVDQTQGDAELDAYVSRLTEEAGKQRLPELSQGEHPEALYYVPNRHGISVIALHTTDLTEAQVIRLLTYRLGQYVHSAVGMLNVRVLFEAKWEHEPLSEVNPRDVHFIATLAGTGEILCYAVLRSAPELPAENTLRTPDRPLFQVEKTHGLGIFNRLRLLPDLPISNVWEVGRFIKNHQFYTFNEFGARAPVEVGVALFRTLSGPLGKEVVAGIGDLEEDVAKQNLDFFHIPMVLIHGTVPYAAKSSFAYHRYQYRTVYPFAVASADLHQVAARLLAIEQALELPGKQGLLALFALKRDIRTIPSSLEPEGGLSALNTTRIDQTDTAMESRAEILDVGTRLREMEPFKGLSIAEAAILGTFMEECTALPGEVIVRQGDTGDDLFVIQSGEADVQVRTSDGRCFQMAVLGPKDYFGEIAMLLGGSRTADVIARTPITLRRLTRASYLCYLAHMSEVEQQIQQAALTRTARTQQQLSEPCNQVGAPSAG